MKTNSGLDDAVLELLHWTFVEIRSAAGDGDATCARDIADAFEMLPALLKTTSQHKNGICPFQITQGDRPEWACSLFIQGRTPGVKNVRGVGPVDALLNESTD